MNSNLRRKLKTDMRLEKLRNSHVVFSSLGIYHCGECNSALYLTVAAVTVSVGGNGPALLPLLSVHVPAILPLIFFTSCMVMIHVEQGFCCPYCVRVVSYNVGEGW